MIKPKYYALDSIIENKGKLIYYRKKQAKKQKSTRLKRTKSNMIQIIKIQ